MLPLNNKIILNDLIYSLYQLTHKHSVRFTGCINLVENIKIVTLDSWHNYKTLA